MCDCGTKEDKMSEKTVKNKSKKQFDYKWIIVATSFLMVMISLGFASSTKTLFPDEIAKELGVDRTLVVIYESVRYIATAIINIFFGALIAKFGPKKLIGAGYLSLVTAILLFGFAKNLWMIYLGGMFLGIGFSWTSTTMVGYVIDIWCSENKGTIMGFVLASNGLGGAIAIKLVGDIIDPTVTGSYRKAYFMIAAVLAVTFVILMIFFRSKPKGYVEGEVKRSKGKKRGQDWVGISLSDAMRKFYFWGAVVCVFFGGFVLQGTYGIVGMHMKDVGIDYDRVKALLSFGSLIMAGAKFLTGFLYDKFGLRVSATICMGCSIIATGLLIAVRGNDTGFVLAVIYSVVAQCAMPLETIMLPIYASDLFGKKSYAKILGLFSSVNVIGMATGGPMMNLCFDKCGSYVPALIAVGCVMSVVIVLLQIVISKAHKEQKRIIAEYEAQQLLMEEKSNVGSEQI